MKWKRLRLTMADIEIITVARATPEHPRHGAVDLIELNDGSLFMVKMLARRSGRDMPANDDATFDLAAMRSCDGGRTWQPERTLVRTGPGDTSVYHPGLLRLRTGDILFRYDVYHRFVKGELPLTSALVCRSGDECRTFSDPVAIWSRSPHHFGACNDMRQLSTGRIVVPACFMEGVALQNEGKGLSPDNTSRAGCFYSDDDGRTWHECASYAYLPMRGCMEPKVEELRDGRLLMVMRTQLGSVFQSFSEDGGVNWSKPQTTGLSAPESCPALLRHPKTGQLILIWNHSPYDPRFDHYGLRSPLSVALSDDEGRTWSKSLDLETDRRWEFTNPSAVVTRDGKLLVAYEASPYASLDPPGALGRTLVDLKLAVVDLNPAACAEPFKGASLQGTTA